MKHRVVIEKAIGETRAAVYEGRKLVELHLDRWSDFDKPRIGERWCGQVKSIDPSIGGMWVDLGKGPDALLSFKGQKDMPRLTEGQRIDVTIAKEAIGQKGPVVRYADDPSRDKSGPVTLLSLQERLQNRFDDLIIDEASVGAIDTSTERRLAIPGGGTLTIDQTEALIAIDIDKGGASTVMDCCVAAAKLLMAQLRLRRLGGLVIVDFPNLRQPKQRSTVIRLMEEAAERDPASIRIAPFSRFGVVEMTRGQDGTSLDGQLNDRFGRPSLETQSIRTLRALEREAKSSPGAQMTLTVTSDIHDWLMAAPFDWKTPMTERLGARFSVKMGETIDVRGDR